MIAALLALTLALAPAPPATADVIAEIRVHGNQIATDDDVIAIAGVKVGDVMTDATIGDVTKRLHDSKKFNEVQVLKRFASIADATQIVIVIIVDEGPVRLQLPSKVGDPIKVVKRGWLRNLMWVPVLDGEDGYGLTYGAQIAIVDVTGSTGRVSFPLTWGGTKEAGVEFERRFTSGPFSRVTFAGDVDRRKNPAFEIEDGRRRLSARAERALGPLRAGATFGWQHVSFDTARDSFGLAGADLTLDTRIDPILPRNAVYANVSATRLGFSSSSTTPGVTTQWHLEGRGYLGLVGQTVLEATAIKDDADRALPLYLRTLLGGWSNLRGFEAGAFTGDTVVTGSLELRVPLTSALSVGKIGVSAFVDAGKSHDKWQRFGDVSTKTGVGGSVWISAAVLKLSLSVAHGLGGDTRVNFGGGVMFGR